MRKLRTLDVKRRPLTMALMCSLAVLAFGSTARLEAQVELISRTTAGVPGNRMSSAPATTDDGRCVAFVSSATNFPPTIGPFISPRTDVYVFDRVHTTLERVTVSRTGGATNASSQTEAFPPSIDHECTCVAFSSLGSNLVTDDTNFLADVFVRTLGVEPFTERISVGSDGEQANGRSVYARVSGDCTKVVFQSLATNLVPDDTNGFADIFIRDREEGTTTRVNLGPGGVQANADSVLPVISSDGRCVAFASAATNLMPGDTRGKKQVYVACDGEVTCRASVRDINAPDEQGTPANGDSSFPSLNADATLVAFTSLGNNLVPGDNNQLEDVFVHNCANQTVAGIGAGETRRVSVSALGGDASDESLPPSISGDGRFIAFGSYAVNLVSGVPGGQLDSAQMYVRDLRGDRTLLVSVDENGTPGNGSVPGLPPGIGFDGRFVAFASLASNFDVGIPNDHYDVFITQTVPSCMNDDDCPAADVCVDGECVRPTITPTKAITDTPTITPSPTFTPTTPSSPTPTDTPTVTPTNTVNTPTITATNTPTNTVRPTETSTNTPTITVTTAATLAPTDTPTITPVVPTEIPPTDTPTITPIVPTEIPPTDTPTAVLCAGDCDGDMDVTLPELARCISASKGAPLPEADRCPPCEGINAVRLHQALFNATDGGCR